MVRHPSSREHPALAHHVKIVDQHRDVAEPGLSFNEVGDLSERPGSICPVLEIPRRRVVFPMFLVERSDLLLESRRRLLG